MFAKKKTGRNCLIYVQILDCNERQILCEIRAADEAMAQTILARLKETFGKQNTSFTLSTKKNKIHPGYLHEIDVVVPRDRAAALGQDWDADCEDMARFMKKMNVMLHKIHPFLDKEPLEGEEVTAEDRRSGARSDETPGRQWVSTQSGTSRRGQGINSARF